MTTETTKPTALHQNRPVLSLRGIDERHGLYSGAAYRRYRTAKAYMTLGRDYFLLTLMEAKLAGLEPGRACSKRRIIALTWTGYAMMVYTFRRPEDEAAYLDVMKRYFDLGDDVVPRQFSDKKTKKHPEAAKGSEPKAELTKATKAVKEFRPEVLVKRYRASHLDYKGLRVLTLRQIDLLHNKAKGTAGNAFRRHLDKLKEGTHYFNVPKSEAVAIKAIALLEEQAVEWNTSNVFHSTELLTPSTAKGSSTLPARMGPGGDEKMILITERGYLLLVKPYRDELSYRVQDLLAEKYFNWRKLLEEKELAFGKAQTKLMTTLQKQGMDKDWIDWWLRMRSGGKSGFAVFSACCRAHGCIAQSDFSNVTDAINKQILGMTSSETKRALGLKAWKPVRDNLTMMQLAAIQLTEVYATFLFQHMNASTAVDCVVIAGIVGEAISAALGRIGYVTGGCALSPEHYAKMRCLPGGKGV